MAADRPFTAYVICGTPRSGSTLLCEMLWASGVAGRPNSFFREQSVGHFADKWGVAHHGDFADPDFNARYLAAMLRQGRAGTNIFGLRLMYQSLIDLERRFAMLEDSQGDVVARMRQAFGSLLFIHLTRRDRIGQAISRLRAEQSGLWHRATDGSVLEGPVIPSPISYDRDRITSLIEEVEADEAGWTNFFATHAITPLRLDYETLAANPHATLGTVLAALGQDRTIARSVSVPTQKLSDGVTQAWADRYRQT